MKFTIARMTLLMVCCFFLLTSHAEEAPGKTDVLTVNPLLSEETDEFIVDEQTKTLLQYVGDDNAVQIPDGIRHIGDRAFAEKDIQYVYLPDSVISIGNYAFYRCGRLEEITLPDRVAFIGDYAFYDCYSLRSPVLPENLVMIGNFAFSWYDGVDGESPDYETLRIPAGVVYIGPDQQSFSGWTEHIVCPRFEIAGENPFYRIEDGMLIGHGLLMDYYEPAEDNPLQIVTVPDDVSVIGPCAFEGSHVMKVIFPKELREIRQAAFWNCCYLMDLTIDFETVSIGKGILFMSGLSWHTADYEDDISPKDFLMSYGTYTDDGEYVPYEPPVSREVLDMLPDSPVLTLLNVESVQMTEDGYENSDDPLSCLATLKDDTELYMAVRCNQEWVSEYREQSDDDDCGYSFEFVD